MGGAELLSELLWSWDRLGIEVDRFLSTHASCLVSELISDWESRALKESRVGDEDVRHSQYINPDYRSRIIHRQ